MELTRQTFKSHAYSAYRNLRDRLECVPALRGPIQLAAELKSCVVDDADRVRDQEEKLFKSRVDPHGFLRESEHLRFWRAEKMLDEVRGNARFSRALEIGCAEGMFTERLLARCESLLAVDFSPTALSRARERCASQSQIRFEELDLRYDVLEGPYDLILAIGILEYIRQPGALRQVRAKLVNALSPGGYLLVGNTVAEPEVEDSWWGRRLIRGTWINAFMAECPALKIISQATDECACPFQHVLLRKVG